MLALGGSLSAQIVVSPEAFSDDYPTQKLIQKWIDGETEHMNWEAQYLNYIEKLGYENFLIAMM